MAKPGHRVTIGTPDSPFYLDFNSKKDALAHFSRMLNSYRNGQTLNEFDAGQLHGLLERHPSAADKTGVGVKRFYRDKAKDSDCFWLEREDGTKTDFFFQKCVSAKPKTLLQDFAEACRYAVQDSLARKKAAFFEEYGDKQGRVKCEVTGNLVAQYEAHLDHKKPLTFQVIVYTFVKSRRIELHPSMIVRPADGEFSRKLADKNIEMQFVEYHDGVADLRIVAKQVNLQLAGSARIIPSKRPVV
jgi:hypothetical protein